MKSARCPPCSKAACLRVLQEREVRRVGDNVPTYINVRVLAATNEPLEKKMKDGSFREDLYYRLNVIAINLPSLRERKDDIPLLVAHFLKNKINPRSGQPLQITRPALEALSLHDWPGNVRELENAIERAATLCEESLIQLRDLPPALVPASLAAQTAASAEIAELPSTGAPAPKPANAAAAAGPALAGITSPGADLSLKDFLREQELAYLNRALALNGGDKEKTAIHLGVSLATLYRKLSEAEG